MTWRQRLAAAWHALGNHAWHYPDGTHACRRHCTRPGCNVHEIYDGDDDAGWGGMWVPVDREHYERNELP